tara:strand:- start:2034 stop:2345 length:312 start_codon:yes stop_codon:yes gene_type:complete
MKSIRIFYNKQTGDVVWTHALEGTGDYPTTESADLSEIPKKPKRSHIDEAGVVVIDEVIGGAKSDYNAVEITDGDAIAAAMSGLTRSIQGSELIVGGSSYPID